jgi:hypothetical protein
VVVVTRISASFGPMQAAKALYIRLSTLSRRLRDLEYRLNAVLFVRMNGGTSSPERRGRPCQVPMRCSTDPFLRGDDGCLLPR